MSRPTCPAPALTASRAEHVVLTIQAERTSHYGDSEQVIVAERLQGGRAAALAGEGADSENPTASDADGVLHVTIPASPKAQARRVEVTRAAGGSRVVPAGTAEPGEAPASSTGGGAGRTSLCPATEAVPAFPPRSADRAQSAHFVSPKPPPPQRQNRPTCAQRPGPNVQTQPANIRRSARSFGRDISPPVTCRNCRWFASGQKSRRSAGSNETVNGLSASITASSRAPSVTTGAAV
jgi:hypothetical protein